MKTSTHHLGEIEVESTEEDFNAACQQLFPRGLFGVCVDAMKMGIPMKELYDRIITNLPMEVEAVRLQRICRESLADKD